MALKRVQLIDKADKEPSLKRVVVNPRPKLLAYKPAQVCKTYEEAMARIDRAFALFHENPDHAPWFLVMATPDGGFYPVALVKADQGNLVLNKAFAGIVLARR